MALLKCKMCGGDLVLPEGGTIAECMYCGSLQTVPSVDSEKKLTLFNRANRLRLSCEFDKAAGVYEAIVADFPEEAEAYWGLVLCKYGIEYVDDSATGKKVPTCHRSSFDGIMEDGDFEQALENADPDARKVYREEAKQIEVLRKGILEVSSREDPYDIFICYKETDDNGDRTLDSVLAQDVYDALTDKGYRVFFSRISLEDKLGMEYEPYIFSALNSAKIMLAFGTDYEYFNAVWVKNEWSRFLKLVATDKDKHLIPCFKGIDAYDMPKEFARLQAQDLGKVGAIQDLLRGIEKLLPRKEQVVTIREKVVVGGGGDNKVVALLDRGNMALEDGDWAKADSFFEDVLNNDAKNAQAYLGKTLAQEKCRTIDAFIRKRKEMYQSCRKEILRLQPKTEHIEKQVKEYTIPGYVDEATIYEAYGFELSYSSEAVSRRLQYNAEQKYWQEHKYLARVEQFAVGAVAENLQKEKQALFAALSERVRAAEAAETAVKAELQAAYEAHIAKADANVKALYENGHRCRDEHYQNLQVIAETSNDVTQLRAAFELLCELGDYRESKNLAQHCRERAEAEQEKLDAEAEQQRLLRLRQERARRKKLGIILLLVAVALAMLLAAYLFITQYVIPNNEYQKAEEMMANGQFVDAAMAFDALDDFGDSESMVLECYYRQALAWVAEGRYDLATPMLINEARNHKNSNGLLDVIAAVEVLKMSPQGNHLASIRRILSGSIPVEIRYDTNCEQKLEPAVYQSEEQLTELAVPENEGYRFNGWIFTNNQYSIGGNMVLSFRADWRDDYLITYFLDGGTAQNPAEYRKDSEDVVLTNPTKTGYTFLGWTGTDLDGLTMDVTIPSGSYGNREYTANWKANEYTITLDANGGSASSNTVAVVYGENYSLPIPVKEGYQFGGWYNDSVKYSDGQWTQTNDVSLTARWEAIGYSIRYELAGGTNAADNPVSYNAEANAIMLQSPTRKGYKFLGWYKDAGHTTKIDRIEKGSSGDLTLYAKWEIQTYTITYHLDGGTNASPNIDSFNIDSAKITLKDPSRNGYQFAGWYKDSGYKNKATEIPAGSSENVELYAKWEAVRYTITYKLDGGSNGTKNPDGYTIEDTATLQAPTKNGCKFLGWYSDSKFKNQVTNIPKGSQGNMTLYAKWEMITYTITYQTNGGTISGTQKTTFTVNDLPLTLPKATKTDFMFLGWKEGDQNGKTLATITECGNVTLYAAFMDSYLQMELHTPYSWEENSTPYYSVKKYSGTAKVVDIPSEYDGCPVTEIGSDAFSGNANLVTVNIPNTITKIGSNAFSDCIAIVSITIPGSITTIDSSAFEGCTALASVSLPDSVTSIGVSAFDSCSSLASVKLPKKLTYLGNSAFEDCTALKSINIPGMLKKIDYCTFNGCSNLASVTLNEGLESISFGAFASKKLTKLIIPKSVTSINDEAFNYETYGEEDNSCSNVVFFCRAASMPSGWATGWNNDRPIVWGYDENSYEVPTYTFVTNGGSAVASQTTLEITEEPVCTRAGYALCGWYTDANFAGEPVSFPYYSASATKLHAKWIPEDEYYNGSTLERGYRVNAGSPNTMQFVNTNQEMYYCFIPKNSASYTISTTKDSDISCYCYLYDSDGNQLKSDSNIYGGQIEITYNFVAGQKYFIEVQAYHVYSDRDNRITLWIY